MSDSSHYWSARHGMPRILMRALPDSRSCNRPDELRDVVYLMLGANNNVFCSKCAQILVEEISRRDPIDWVLRDVPL